MSQPSIAIVGAGLAGLVCATELAKSGCAVEIFDKGRFAGGRLAARYRDQYTFDYGAQYFTAREHAFRQFLAPLLRHGRVARWKGRFAKLVAGRLCAAEPHSARYVGSPVMRSLAEQLSSSLNCHLSHRVTKVFQENDRWTVSGLVTNEGNDRAFTSGNYDVLVINLPAAQAAQLHRHDRLEHAVMLPCLALQVAFEQRVEIDFDGITLDDPVISWAARDSSKPGRGAGERWVIHASPNWSAENYDNDIESIEKILLERFATTFDITLPPVLFKKLQKWRYALPDTTIGAGCIKDTDNALFYCGDWCLGPRVECAFQSGLSAAEEIKRFIAG